LRTWRLLAYVVFEPERQSQLTDPPRGEAIRSFDVAADRQQAMVDAATYVGDEGKIGTWRICRLFRDDHGEPRWVRLSNADERDKTRAWQPFEQRLRAEAKATAGDREPAANRQA
jgi:hypothetical protein